MTDVGKPSLQRPLFYVLLVFLVFLTYLVLQPFLAALAWAVIFAVLLHGAQTRIAARIGPNGAALLTTLLVAIAIVTPAAFLISTLVHEVSQITNYLQQATASTPDLIERLWRSARMRIPIALPEDPTELLAEGARRAVAFLAPRAGSVVVDVFATTCSLLGMLFALFFLLRDGQSMSRRLRDQLPFSREDGDRLLHDTRDLVIASIGAGVVVAATQGLVGGVAFWLLGLAAPVLWGVAMAVASLIPVVGAALVWVPAAIGLLLSGHVGRGVALLVIGTLGISMVDNVLRPLILSGRTAVSGLVVFFGLLGGVTAFGFIGIVIGPIVLVTTGTLLGMLRRSERQDRRATDRAGAGRSGPV